MSDGLDGLDTKEAARYIGMSEQFLEKDRCNGTLRGRTPGPPYYKIGRRVLYKRADLDAWLEERRVERPSRAGGNRYADRRVVD